MTPTKTAARAANLPATELSAARVQESAIPQRLVPARTLPALWMSLLLMARIVAMALFVLPDSVLRGTSSAEPSWEVILRRMIRMLARRRAVNSAVPVQNSVWERAIVCSRISLTGRRVTAEARAVT
jgi:hypothetical protein